MCERGFLMNLPGCFMKWRICNDRGRMGVAGPRLFATETSVYLCMDG